MRLITLLLLMLSIAYNAASAADIKSRDEIIQSPWPTFDPKRLPEYYVKREESILHIPYLFIPKNHRICLKDDVERIDWVIDTLEFEEGATVNLAFDSLGMGLICHVNKPLPDLSPSVPTYPGQAASFMKGHKGYTGIEGAPGKPGRPLIWTVGKLVLKGNLWIRTDGQVGNTGKAGGVGERGGDGYCKSDKDLKAGDGGDCGDGGRGGKGGTTSTVIIKIASLPQGYVYEPEACMQEPGPSKKPATAVGDEGKIAIWGGKGKGGEGGPVGFCAPGSIVQSALGGDGRSGCTAFPIYNWSVAPGDQGSIGKKGPDGPSSKDLPCGSAKIIGPISR